MKKILIGIFVLVVSATLLVACGGSGSSSKDEPEKINGIVVPPDPGEAGKETLAGIDSNENGVRDDVERKIAEMFGNDNNFYELSKKHSVEVQKLISSNQLSPDHDRTLQYRTLIVCSTDEELSKYTDITKYHTNTNDRSNVFSNQLSGLAIREGVVCD